MGWFSDIWDWVKDEIIDPIKEEVIDPVIDFFFGGNEDPISPETQKYEEPSFQQVGAQGILVQRRGTNTSIPVIYGKTLTGGTRVFIKSTGTDNVDLHIAIVLCEGEIHNVTKIYFDDVVAATNNGSSGDSDSWTIASPWSSHVTVKFRAGTDSQAAISDLTTQMGGDPRFRGVAYLYIKLVYDTDGEVWKQGLPAMTYEVEGKKVPQTDDGTTMGYSDNPARCILDYLTNTRYGKSIPVSQIDLPSFASAESYFATSGVDFHCRGNLKTGINMYDNLIDLVSCCNSSVALGDKYQLIPAKTGSSIMTLDSSNTVGNVTYGLASKAQLLNSIKVKFMDETTEYKDNIKIVDDPTGNLTTQDNGNLLQRELFLPFTKTLTIASRLATQILNQSRQSHMINLTATIEAIKLQVGDIVGVTNETFGITNKLFRVRQTTLQPTSEIDLVLQEYDPDVYGADVITDARDDDND
jgi:hypothetical protein